MILTAYSQSQKTEDDDRVYRLMRARSIQEAIGQIGITDPPRNSEEYRGSLEVFRYHILRNQPLALTPDISFEQATEVAANGVISVNARGATYQWAYVALLAAALGENLREAGAGMMGVWETSCQFTDELFAMGIKLTFAIGTTMLTIPEARPIIDNIAWTILGLYYGETAVPRVQRHDYATHDLNVDLFMLLQFLARTDRAHLGSELMSIGVSLESFADAFDTKSNARFRMKDWVKDFLAY